ncbi:MAG: SRPBCC family protein [Flavobacteriales bacterium]
MKILKYFLIVVLAIVGIYLIICATGDKEMKAGASTTIGASASSVFEEINDYARYKAWSPWIKMDTAIVNEFSGTPGTVGHKNTWKSKVLGDGTQEFVEVRTDEFIKMELRFVDWGDKPSYSTYTLAQAGDSTKITWEMDGGEIPFMMRGMMVLMGGGNAKMSEIFASGLKDLKAIAEKKPKAEAVKYEVVDITDTPYLGQLHKGLVMDAVDSSLFANAFTAVGGQMGKTPPAGMPFCIGRMVNYETHMMDLEICMPTATEMPAAAGFTSGKIPAGRCAKFVYTGPYEGTASAWDPFMKQIEKDGLKIRWDGYEVYANDPGEVKDPAKFITWLMVPVE